MMNICPIFLSDSYKQWHYHMYPEHLRYLYSNCTPRKSRIPGVDKAVWFGLQGFIKEYLIKQWTEQFFQKPWPEIEKAYKRFHKNFSQVEDADASHWKAIHDLGYLPIRIKALPEGSLVPMRVPFFTIINTHGKFAWLVNFLETQISTSIWDPTVVATISYQFRKMFDKYALETTGSTEGVQWQGHDFSMRGRSSIETSFNQAGHLLSFTGTDTIPAVMYLEEYYNADMDKELIGGSVPASEHSVMMCLGKEGEMRTFEYLLDKFQTGILSVVSDTWNLWDVLTKYLPALKEKIMARPGKLVIRPDSGKPEDIICGKANEIIDGEYYYSTGDINGHPVFGDFKREKLSEAEGKGVVELLWDVFGGTVNDKGYKVLHPCIGTIYGDAITMERAIEINERLKAKGFASTNWAAGIGSYTFNMNTRDTLGIAIKATHCTLGHIDEDGVHIEERDIFKDPITDSGEKKSAKGLLMVYEEDGELKLKDQCTPAEEQAGLLTTVFQDGKLLVDQSLSTIRQRLHANI